MQQCVLLSSLSCFVVEATIISVAKATFDITDWEYIALLLGISEADLKCIKINHGKSQHKSIIKKWLDSGNASWAALVSALRHELVGKGAVANAIAKKHPKSN